MASLLSLVPTLAGFLGYGFSSILLACIVLVSSSIFLIYYLKQRQRQRLEVKPVTEETPRAADQESSHQMDDAQCEPEAPQKECTRQKEENQEEDGRAQIDEYNFTSLSSPVTLPESDCVGRSSTSEDSEADSPFHDRIYSSDDGSISDEESLIEISLPGGQYVGHKEEQTKLNLQKKLPVAEFVAGSFFKQHGLVELLAELNELYEEENLIEIDISMGSIKCPRFEIEA